MRPKIDASLTQYNSQNLDSLKSVSPTHNSTLFTECFSTLFFEISYVPF